MKLIPSIDLQDGKCVRLEQGDFERVVIYGEDPSAQAKSFCQQGATVLHVVDLDGAREEEQRQLSAIAKIRQSFAGVIQVGGGIRTLAHVDSLFEIGVDRVVLGSLSVIEKDFTLSFLKRFGLSRVVLALDIRMKENSSKEKVPLLAIKGWKETTPESLWDLLGWYPSEVQILCTDISKDGMERGPSFDLYRELARRHPASLIQASGGITTLDDLVTLKKLGLGAAIVGKAIYQGRFKVSEALTCLK